MRTELKDYLMTWLVCSLGPLCNSYSRKMQLLQSKKGWLECSANFCDLIQCNNRVEVADCEEEEGTVVEVGGGMSERLTCSLSKISWYILHSLLAARIFRRERYHSLVY